MHCSPFGNLGAKFRGKVLNCVVLVKISAKSRREVVFELDIAKVGQRLPVNNPFKSPIENTLRNPPNWGFGGKIGVKNKN